MKSLLLSSILLVLITLSCKKNEEIFKGTVNDKMVQEEMNFELDSLLTFRSYRLNKPKDYIDDYKGIESYNCFIDAEEKNELKVKMNWGFMQVKSLEMRCQGSNLKIEFSSAGCTSSERFEYITLEQDISFNSLDFMNLDTIIGRISYRGIQDIESKKKEWKGYDLPIEWLNNISPTIVEVNGQFKLIKFRDSSFRGEEYNAFKNYLIEIEKDTKKLENELNEKRNPTNPR